MEDHYRYVREHYPETYRKVVEVGLAVTCAPKEDDRLSLGAAAENRAMEIVAELLRRMAEEG